MDLTWKERVLGRVQLPPPLPPAPPAPATLPTPQLTYSAWTLAHWQASEPHRQYALDLFKQPMFRDVLAVMNNLRPAAPPRQVSDTEAAIQLGVRLGLDMAMGTLLQLPELPPKPPAPVEPTYNAEAFDFETGRFNHHT